MPFRNLTDNEVNTEFQTPRQICIDKFSNNGFLEHVKNVIENTQSAIEIGKYFDIDQCNTLMSRTPSSLTVYHMNVRRIAKNRAGLLAFLSTMSKKFDILILTEVGDDANNYLYDDFSSDYNIFTCLPESNKYGGVAILVNNLIEDIKIRDDLSCKKQCDCSRCICENLWIEFNMAKTKYILGAVYRHPNGNTTHFTQSLTSTLDKIDPSASAIFAGDLNIDLMKFEVSASFDYYTTLATHGFVPYIVSPTRVTDYSATLIDHVFVKQPARQAPHDIKSGIIYCDLTDHLPSFILLSRLNKSQSHSRPLTRIFGDKNMAKFKTDLTNINWNLLLKGDATKNVQIFYDTIRTLYNKNFPLVRLSRKRYKDKPWINTNIKNCIKHKNKLYKKQLHKATLENILQYKAYRNRLTSLLRESEIAYYGDILHEQNNAITNFWKSFKYTLSPDKFTTKTRLRNLQVDNKTLTNDEDIADGLNNFFCTIGSKISEGLQTPTGHFRDYLKKRTKSSFFLSPASEHDIRREILALRPKKSPGPDNLTPKLIKQCVSQLTTPLTIIINQCINEATFPTEWKLAKVIALYKKNSRKLPENYRPISLLNCFGKIFEKIIYKQMIKFIDKHKILYLHQYGFRKHFSTCLALIDMIDKIKEAIDKNEYSLGIYLDIKKAFDSLEHSILIEKLEFYGFRGHISKLLQDYLTNRKQFTLANGCQSGTREITHGVPQGSILGPLFFLIYINDIQNVQSNVSPRLFADDTALIFHDNDISNLKLKAEEYLLKLYKWYLLNKLALSIDKSNFLLFHGKRKNPAINFQSLNIQGESINRCPSVKYIGLRLDETLSWRPHVDDLCKSLSKLFGIFYNIRHFLNDSLARGIYYAMIHSRIKYGIEVYGASSSVSLNKLQVIQNKLLKLLTKRPRETSTNIVHNELKILKVRDIYALSLQMFAHNCVHGKPVEPFMNYYTVHNSLHTHHTRSCDHLVINRFNTEIGRSTTHNASAFLWNKLPSDLKNLSDASNFKRSLIANYLEKYSH
jgi:hypothetical protein